MPPPTTKEGQQQFKSKKKKKKNPTQNCQNIKLYGSPKTKELKKKHSSRLVRGAETGSQGRKDAWQCCGWWTRWSHICVWINLEEQLGSETDCATQCSSLGKRASKSGCKNLWRLQQQEKLPASQESLLERSTGSLNIDKPIHQGISTRRAQFACGNQGR